MEKTIYAFINGWIYYRKLQVFSFNKPAIRSYEKCGFVKEGVLRKEFFRFGQFYHIYIFGLLIKGMDELKLNEALVNMIFTGISVFLLDS
ncbi:GNAT family N-acetyltransferase [Virgibacillus proomii]|uniref:GNAT family N-acetyltransferase n=1 Tax=Virgibacillus proomii TaxID=84407 RepID=UPI00209EFAA2|nr:GNAT family protein [Virgibacillus proomii]